MFSCHWKSLLPKGLCHLIFTEFALRPIQSLSRDVRLSVCLSGCVSGHCKTPSSGGGGNFGSNCVLLIFACNDTFFSSVSRFGQDLFRPKKNLDKKNLSGS